jgi:hypothetical protein
VRRLPLAALAIVALTTPREAHAIRPFITDDARVVGGGHLQVETWWRRDRHSLEHWVLGAIGPNDHIELTLGGVHGAGPVGGRPAYSLAGPLLQAKILLNHALPNEAPGVALSVGGLPPVGRGAFAPPGWTTFAYVALTQALVGEDIVLIHANLGYSAVDAPGFDALHPTWGVGTQIHAIWRLHGIAEIFSGDPYGPGAGGAYQVGFRYIFNDYVQLDSTFGDGFFGAEMPFWVSAGVRLVSHPLW